MKSTIEEQRCRAAHDERVRQEIADRTIAEAHAFMEASERREGRADGLLMLRGRVAEHLRACLAASDLSLWHDDLVVNLYAGYFCFRLLCTSLGYERVKQELLRVVRILEGEIPLPVGFA